MGPRQWLKEPANSPVRSKRTKEDPKTDRHYLGVKLNENINDKKLWIWP